MPLSPFYDGIPLLAISVQELEHIKMHILKDQRMEHGIGCIEDMASKLLRLQALWASQRKCLVNFRVKVIVHIKTQRAVAIPQQKSHGPSSGIFFI